MYFISKYVFGKLIVRHLDFCLVLLWAGICPASEVSGWKGSCSVEQHRDRVQVCPSWASHRTHQSIVNVSLFSAVRLFAHMVLCTAIRSLFCLLRFIFFTSVALSISHQRPAAYLCEAHIWSGFGIFN